MPLQDALTFVSEARTNGVVARELEALDSDSTLEALAEIGASHGLAFTPEELERAHALDWGMRWARYRRTEPG